MKLYSIPEFGIKVHIEGGAGTIESKLKEQLIGPDSRDENELLAIIDALEALILAHACAGIDVASPAYVDGLRSSLDAIANHF